MDLKKLAGENHILKEVLDYIDTAVLVIDTRGLMIYMQFAYI